MLILPRDTQYIAFGALQYVYVFLRLSSVSCILCYRKNKSADRFEHLKPFMTVSKHLRKSELF